RVKIEKWNECEQSQADDAFFGAQIIGELLQRDPQRQRRCQYRQEIKSPIRSRKQCKPPAHDGCSKGRMLWITEREVTGPGDQLRHIGVQVLAAFGDDTIKRPDQEIASES